MAATSARYSEVSDDDGIEEHHPIHQPPNFLQRAKRRIAPTSVCLLSYCLVALTTMTVLLSILLLKKGQCKKCVNEVAFEASYGKNYELQSVSHLYDHYWEAMSGDSSVIDLPDPRVGGDLIESSVSMFHQLHCLTSLRHAIQMAHDGKDPGLDYHDNAHWPHCMDYLRKTILCWADGTIERHPLLPNGTWINFIDGTTDVRKCGDSRKLVQQMRDSGKKVVPAPFPGD